MFRLFTLKYKHFLTHQRLLIPVNCRITKRIQQIKFRRNNIILLRNSEFIGIQGEKSKTFIRRK